MSEHRIFPHGDPVALAPNLWQVTGSLPFPLKRNMTIYRLPNGKLVLYSVVALDDGGMKKLEALGEPAYIVVPHALHVMDAPFYRRRYPEARMLAEADAQKRVRCDVDATTQEGLKELAASGVRTRIVPGMRFDEVVLDLDIEGGRAIVVTDVATRGAGPKDNFAMRLLGPPGPFGTPRIVKFRQVKDKRAIAGFFTELAGSADIAMVAASHGPPLVADCSAAFREAAAGL
jgi:hypothetical protein